MRAETISAGDVLELKRGRARAYGIDVPTVEVVRLKPRPGYLTPIVEGVYRANARAAPANGFFAPSDFERRTP